MAWELSSVADLLCKLGQFTGLLWTFEPHKKKYADNRSSSFQSGGCPSHQLAVPILPRQGPSRANSEHVMCEILTALLQLDLAQCLCPGPLRGFVGVAAPSGAWYEMAKQRDSLKKQEKHACKVQNTTHSSLPLRSSAPVFLHLPLSPWCPVYSASSL